MNRQQVRGSAARRLAGFTLVELLVVIVIIGILVALLIPVLGMARAAVQEASIKAEVASLAQAMDAFKTQYQTDYPPDFSLPVVVPLGGGRQRNVIDEFMARTHRYRIQDARQDRLGQRADVPRQRVNPQDPKSPLVPGAAPLPTALLNQLDPAEALVFWLRGFADDAAHPLFGPVQEQGQPPIVVQRTPLFDFDESRLRDADGDGFFEYYPRYGSDLPYVYLVHYNYPAAFKQPDFRARRGPTDASFPCPRPYLQSRSDPSQLTNDYLLLKDNYAAPDKFQIIAAGLDNSFGLQVDPNNFRAFTTPQGPYPDKPHLDNVANFAEGTLEDQLP